MKTRYDEIPPEFEPRRNPLDRYAHLPEHTRVWLERLDQDDIQALKDLVKSYHRAAVLGWFFKVVIFGMVGIFTASVIFGEKVREFYGWFVGS